MNYKMIRYILGWVLKVTGLLMLLPCLIALVYGESQGWVYLLTALPAILIGQLLSRRPENMEIYQKEGFVSVGLSWVMISAYGAIPFVLTGEIPGYLNALFEIVSGFTTTGASILTDVEALSHTSLLWRSFSHWIGGMGVLVFILMLIPMRNGGSHMNLMRAESPGPDVNKFVPRVRGTAQVLYQIYLALTIAEFVILLVTRMYWFDALCITFGTAGTGGFGVLNSSCASYTALQQWIITVFMMAFGVNFSFYFLLLSRRGKEVLKMEEVFWYLLIFGLATGLIMINVLHQGLEDNVTVREAAFQTASIMTTTGFSTTDFNLWPSFSKMILVVLMMIGACAGSTGGGVKVSRVLIMAKSVKQEIRQLLYPRSVRRVRVNGSPVQDITLHSTYAYVMTYIFVYAISLLLVSRDGFSFETSFTAVAATLNNIGPGLGMVGPAGNYMSLGIVSKIVLIFDMLAGRLELLPIFVLMYPATWRKH